MEGGGAEAEHCCCSKRTSSQGSIGNAPDGSTGHVESKDEDVVVNNEVDFLVVTNGKTKQYGLWDASSKVEVIGRGVITQTYRPYDEITVHEIIAKMIILNKLPLRFVENPLLNELLKAVNPHFESISECTIVEECMDLYETEMEKVRETLESVEVLSLACCPWTSNLGTEYMCLTAHYVDADWKLQRQMINFFEAEDQHIETKTADVIRSCLCKWGIEKKLSTITLDDNCSNNEIAGTLMEMLTGKGNILFNRKFFHIKCCVRTFNLMAKDALYALEEAISNIRKSIRHISKSTSCLKKFGELARRLDIPTSGGLYLDMANRWNSTYNMLDTALQYKLAFQQYSGLYEDHKWLPSEEDWKKVENGLPLLSVCHNVIQLFSATSPAINMLLLKFVKVKYILLKKSSSEDECIKKAAVSMIRKLNNYQKECDTVVAIAAILDPRYKMEVVKYCLSMRSEPKVEERIDELKHMLYELFNLYENQERSKASAKQPEKIDIEHHSPTKRRRVDYDYEMFDDNYERFLRSTYTEPEKPELDRYLDQPRMDYWDSSFNAIDWWRLWHSSFPVLSRMARDILLIPISSVAPEDAFNQSNRVLTSHWCSLSAKSIEALVCTANWIRSQKKDMEAPTFDYDEEKCFQIEIPE